VRSEGSTLVSSGFDASDPHGFATGETTEITLRDTSGRALTSYTLTPASGGTVGDLVADLNASPLSNFGSFSLDDRGRFRFEPAPSVSGAALSIPSDSTDRYGTGQSFSSLMRLTGSAHALDNARVRADVLADPAKLPLARLQDGAAVGAKALGPGDTRGANAFVERLGQAVDFGKDGVATIERFSSLMLGRTGLQAAQAEDSLADATARRNDAVTRRDSFSGVNIDEELAQMVVLQNSYSAAARVLTTASEMYDTLIAMVR
jgi:flagellar hook-associated protein 1